MNSFCSFLLISYSKIQRKEFISSISKTEEPTTYGETEDLQNSDSKLKSALTPEKQAGENLFFETQNSEYDIHQHKVKHSSNINRKEGISQRLESLVSEMNDTYTQHKIDKVKLSL